MHFPFKTEFELIKKYRFKSIFWVYFRYIFIVVLIPVMIISSIVSFYYSYTTKSEFSNNFYDKVRASSVSAESAFKEVDSAHFQLSASDEVVEYASATAPQYAGDVYSQILRLIMYGRYIESIHVYFPLQEFIISNTETGSLYKYSQRSLFNPPIDSDLYKYTIYDNEKGILHYAHPIYINSTVELIAIYDIKIYEIISNLNEDTEIYITEKGSNKIIYSGANTDERVMNDKDILKAINSPNKVLSGSDSAFVSIPIYNGQYNFIGKAHTSTTPLAKTAICLVILAIIIMTLLIPFLVAFYFSSRLYSSVAELTSAFGGYNENPDENSNELIFLSNNIGATLEKNKSIENQLTSNMQNLKTLQSQALQMQISPHFIFNTLNLANVIIMRELKRSNDAEKVISHLANLMSVALDTKNTIIPIREELRYIEEFIEIEKIRFKNKFDVVYDISPEVYDRNMIKFTLQPIMENAFEYGIKPLRDERGKITVKAWSKGADTLFTVSNNGKQIDADKLYELRKTLDSPNTPEKHIGLYNVNKRIKLMCGEKYGVHITSTPNMTSVTLRFKF